jgi:4-hydroxybenzoate polyprenyltransferase
MLMTLAAVLAIIWLIGLIAGVGGAFIHLLLVVALAIFIYDMFVARRHSHI